jgi:hypothetical protein
MLEGTVELLGGLFLSALTLLIGSCIVGSIVAALRAVSRGSACEYEKERAVFGSVAEVTVDYRTHDIAYRKAGPA